MRSRAIDTLFLSGLFSLLLLISVDQALADSYFKVRLSGWRQVQHGNALVLEKGRGTKAVRIVGYSAQTDGSFDPQKFSTIVAHVVDLNADVLKRIGITEYYVHSVSTRKSRLPSFRKIVRIEGKFRDTSGSERFFVQRFYSLKNRIYMVLYQQPGLDHVEYAKLETLLDRVIPVSAGRKPSHAATDSVLCQNLEAESPDNCRVRNLMLNLIAVAGGASEPDGQLNSD